MEQETAGPICHMAGRDSQAFGRLMELYYPKILCIVYFISGSHADSEDVVQETLVLCWMNRKKIEEPEYLGNWLYETLTRKVWQYCRKNRKEQPVEKVFGKEEPEITSVLEGVMMHSQEEKLYEVIENFSVKQRTVVVLYYFDQVSTREIAGIVGCLEGTARSRLHAARTNLKQELMEERKRIGGEVIL